MTNTILWKELREQAAILVALAVLGAGIIVAAATLGTAPTAVRDPLELRGYGEPARIATIMLIFVGGTVCGGMIFANERENGTADFLLHLPANRRRLWVAKFAAGLLLTTLVTVALGLVAGATGQFAIDAAAPWLMWFLILAVAAFSSAAVGSAICANVLPACGVGVVIGQILSGFAMATTLVAGRLLSEHFRVLAYESQRPTLAIIAGPVFAAFAGALISFLAFTKPDRDRRRFIAGPGAVRSAISSVKRVNRRLPPSRFGVRTLVWLMLKQWMFVGPVLLAIALIFGGVMAIPDVPIVLAWPIATGVLGVLAGVFAFMPEQLAGSARFWAERSLPAGRLWLAKLLTAGAVLLASLIVAFLPPLVTGIVQENFREGPKAFWPGYFRSMLVDPDGPIIAMLFLWPTYTFAASFVAGMGFRKPVVAIAVGAMVGGSVVAMWVPSMLSGGMLHRLLWPSPLVAILGSRLLVREWATGRLASRWAIAKLAAIVSLALALVAGGIYHRWTEVPIIPEIEDDIAFAAALPSNDDTQAGRDVKRVVAQMKIAINDLRNLRAIKVMPQYGSFSRRNSLQQTEPVAAQLHNVLRDGYPADRPDFDAYLKEFNFEFKTVQPDWAKLRTKPTGVVIDPTELHLFSPYPEVQEFREVATTIAVRGLKATAEGQPDVFLDDYESMLAATRSMQSRTILLARLVGVAVESFFGNAAMATWLDRAGDDPARLARVAAILDRHLAEPPDSPMVRVHAEVTVLRNSMRNPGQWYPKVALNGRTNESKKERAEQEANALQFAWNVPWEKERLRRAIGLLNAPVAPAGKTPEEYLAGLPGLGFFGRIDMGAPGGPNPNWLSQMVNSPVGMRPEMGLRRNAGFLGLRTSVALRQFAVANGRNAATLDELVPTYLPAVPADPYTGKPLRYEVVASAKRTVFLREKTEPPPPPGTDLDNPLTRDEWNEYSTVMGGLVQFPRTPEPETPPGFDGESLGDDTVFQAYPALFGGVIHWPLVTGPGSDPIGASGPGSPGADFEPTPAKPIAVAGLGGVVGFGLQDLPLEFDIFDGPAGMYAPYDRMVPTDLPPGTAILWSVGPDGIDDGGLWQHGYSGNRGDMIWIVPPSKKKP